MTDKNKRLPEKIVLLFALSLFAVMVCVSVVLHFVTHEGAENTLEETNIPFKYMNVEEEPVQEYVYFAVGNGDKYHVDGCPSVTEESERVPVWQKQIDKGNYTPCKKCIK